jgi:hypothetical protein
MRLMMVNLSKWAENKPNHICELHVPAEISHQPVGLDWSEKDSVSE